MKTIAIVAGGTLSKKFVPLIKEKTQKIGADRGAWWLLEQGITPEYAIGDFDSVSEQEMENIKKSSPNVVQYKSEKDETDLELALRLAISLHPDRITVFGSLGTRFDHSLAGIFLLEQFSKYDIEIVNDQNKIRLITNTATIQKDVKFPYCSLLPLSKKAVVTLQSFRYPLDRYELFRYKTMGISNEIVDNVGNIIVHEGAVILVQSRG